MLVFISTVTLYNYIHEDLSNLQLENVLNHPSGYWIAFSIQIYEG